VFQGSVVQRATGLSRIGLDDDMRAVIDKWLAANRLAKLAPLWVEGVDLDWDALYAVHGTRPARIDLPTYPFARERYWLEDVAPEPRSALRLGPVDGREDADRMESIEAIIDQVDAGALATHQAIAFLKKVV
jgi:acyl transferase domain-containing protein